MTEVRDEKLAEGGSTSGGGEKFNPIEELSRLTRSKPNASMLTPLLGVVEDGVEKDFPIGSVVLDISTEGTWSLEDSQKIHRAISGATGLFACTVPGSQNRERHQYVFENENAAILAAENLKLAKLKNPAKIGIGRGRGSVTVVQGRPVFSGNMFENALFAGDEAVNLQADAVVATRTEGEVRYEKISTEGKGGEIPRGFTVNAVSKRSIAHGENLKNRTLLTTSNAVLVTIFLPETHDDRPARAARNHILTRLLKETNDPVFSNGKVVQVLHGGESSPASVGRKLEPILKDLEDKGLRMTLDYGDVQQTELKNGKWAYSSPMFEKIVLPKEAGLWATDAYKQATNHERNRALTEFEYGETDAEKALSKIADIEQVFFTLTVGGCRKVIGREEVLKRMHDENVRFIETGETSVEVIEGEGGIGKTKVAAASEQDIREEAERQGQDFQAIYFKGIEEKKTTPKYAVKMLIEALYKEVRSPEFTDLDLFSRDIEIIGNTEEDKQDRANVMRLNNDNNYLLSRLKLLAAAVASNKKIQLSFDDLQWMDSSSKGVIADWIASLQKISNFKIVILKRPEQRDTTGPKGEDPMIAAAGKHSINFTQLDRLDFRKNKDQLIDFVRYSLPEDEGKPKGWEDEIIVPEPILEALAKVSEGLPIVVKEILEYLMDQTPPKLQVRDGSVFVEEGAIKNIAKKGAIATLNAIFQEKFARLDDLDRSVADHLVVMGAVSIDVFKGVMKKMGLEEGLLEAALRSLIAKKIITREPFGLTHDILREQRLKYLGKRGSVSKIAMQAYETMSGMGEDYPDITPALRFELLKRAKDNADVLPAESKAILIRHFVDFGRQSIDYHMGRHDVERSLADIDAVRKPLQAVLSESVNTGKKREAVNIGNTLYGVMLDQARMFINAERMEEAEKVLAQIGRVFGTKLKVLHLHDGENKMKYDLLKLFMTFKETSRPAPRFLSLETSISQLRVIAELKKEPERTRLLAEAFLTEAEKFRSEIWFTESDLGIQQAARSCTFRAETELRDLFDALKESKILDEVEFAKMKAAFDKKAKQVTSEMKRMRTTRRLETKTTKDPATIGIHWETLYMRQLPEARIQEFKAFLTELTELKKLYERDPSLAANPRSIAAIYKWLPRITFLAHGKTADEIREALTGEPGEGVSELSRLQTALNAITDAINECSKYGAQAEIVSLKTAEGSIELGEGLKSDLGNPINWDPELLLQSRQSFIEAAAEARVTYENGEGPWVDSCNLNAMFNTACYIIALNAKQAHGQSEIDYSAVNQLIENTVEIGLASYIRKRERIRSKIGDPVSLENPEVKDDEGARMKMIEFYFETMFLGKFMQAVGADAGFDRSIFEKVKKQIPDDEIVIREKHLEGLSREVEGSQVYTKFDKQYIAFMREGLDVMKGGKVAAERSAQAAAAANSGLEFDR